MAGPSKGIRLSFLTQADQSKYEMVFTQVAGGRDILLASSAKEVLSRSNIGDENLARIWDLSNVTNQPQLTFPEFATAMYLTSMKMSGSDIPNTLPQSVRNEIQSAVSLVQGNASLTPYGTTQPNLPQTTGLQPSISNINLSQPTGIQPQMTGIQPTQHNLSFASHMMPNTIHHTPSNAYQILSKPIKIPWAVTDQEKKEYSKIFKAWDTDKQGTISGEKAKEIFSQSGLPQNVLMQIWSLSDPNNQGKLNLDEFSVAMHLIYRKLNGYNVPETLPPELIPPSTRDLTESVDQLKKTILQDIAKKKQLQNFRSTPTEPNKKSKDEPDDNEIGYVSSARRMGPNRSGPTSSYGYRGKQTRIFDLRKEIDQYKSRLASSLSVQKPIVQSFQDLSALDKKDIVELKDRIRELVEVEGKEGWDGYVERSAELSNLADQWEAIQQEAYRALDLTRDLLSQVKETEDDLKEKRLGLLSRPSAAVVVLEDLPEADRIKAKARALVAARMNKLTGKDNVDQAEVRKIKTEHQEFSLYAESIKESLLDLEAEVKAVGLEMSMIGLDIRKQDLDQKRIEERARFEHAEGVAPDLKEFIHNLKYHMALATAPDIDPSFESRFPSF